MCHKNVLQQKWFADHCHLDMKNQWIIDIGFWIVNFTKRNKIEILVPLSFEDLLILETIKVFLLF